MSAARTAPGREGGLHDLRLVARQTRYEQLAFWRNRTGAVFTIGFSIVFMFLVGSSAGNSQSSVYHVRYIQYYVPGFAAYGVMAACFTTLAIVLVNRRESGLLKRVRLMPVPTWVFLAAVILSTAVVALIEVVLMVVIGRLAYGVHFPDHVLPLVVALLVGIASFTSLGIAVSTLVPNEDSAGPVVNIIFFVFLFLSGLWFTMSAGSGLARFASWFPFRPFILAMFFPFDVRSGVSPWAWHDIGTVAIWGVVGVVVAARRFQWSPRRGA